MKNFFKLSIFLIILMVQGRSPHRPYDSTMPEISIYWKDNNPSSEHFHLRESHLNESMFRQFDKDYFFDHLIPHQPITYRYEPTKTVDGALLCQLVEQLVEEIQKLPRNARAKNFKNFTVLKVRDVDHHFHTGSYILKFNDYPFVVKLFIEKPESFIRPTQKGFEPMCFYYLGGVGRHNTGFNRIKNMENVKHLTQNHPRWSQELGFPRKWFWLPSKPTWLVIEGKNIGKNPTISVTLPAIYALICDLIIWERPFGLSNSYDTKVALELSNFLEQSIDLHINNFGIEKDTGTLTLIDYEHFPSLVNLKSEKKEYTSYISWYSELSCMMLKRMLFRNKEERKLNQYLAYSPMQNKQY